MDENDLKIFVMLLLNSRLTYREIGNYLGLSLNSVYKRVQNLIDSGIIQKFRAKLNAHAIGAFYSFIYGKSDKIDIDFVVEKLKQNDSITSIFLTNRKYIYIGAFIKNIHHLGEFTSLISKIAGFQTPIVGLRDGSFYSCPVEFIHPKTKNINIDRLDLSIIRSIHEDSRKAISEIAENIKSTPHTVRRRLTRLIHEGLIELTIDPFLEDSRDIFSFILLELPPTADRMKIAQEISDNNQPFIMFNWTFSNLPNMILSWVWTSTIKQLNDLLENLKQKQFISIESDIIRKAFFLDTWIDRLSSNPELDPSIF